MPTWFWCEHWGSEYRSSHLDSIALPIEKSAQSASPYIRRQSPSTVPEAHQEATSSWLFLPRDRITNVNHLAWLLMWRSGDPKSNPHGYVVSTLLTEYPPSSNLYFFLKFSLNSRQCLVQGKHKTCKCSSNAFVELFCLWNSVNSSQHSQLKEVL